MTNAQTEARATARDIEGAIKLREAATALAAKDAELAAERAALRLAAARAERAEAQLAETRKALETLPFVVQYRRKEGGILWVDMAAFDVEGAAERYCRSCAEASSPWDYQVARRALEAQGGENG